MGVSVREGQSQLATDQPDEEKHYPGDNRVRTYFFGSRILLLALFSYMGITLDLMNHRTGSGHFEFVRNVLGSFHRFNMVSVLLIPGLYLIFQKAERAKNRRTRWICILLAIFFALNMVIGFAFEREGNWNMLLSKADGQFLKTIIALLAWSMLFYHLLLIAFHFLETINIRGNTGEAAELQSVRGGMHPVRRYASLFRHHSFATPFFTLLALYIPYIVISYPAMFMGDTWSIIVQAYSELEMTGVSYLSSEDIIQAGIFINQHHPVFYTLLLHAFLVIGDSIFHSLNAGIFLYSIGQTLLMISAFSWAFSSLARRNVFAGWLVALIVYAFLHPQIHNFMFLTTKEGPYAACFILLMTGLFRFRTGEKSRRVIIILCFSTLGMLLLRNEGRYVLILSSLLMALIDQKNRKRLFTFMAACILLALGISSLYRLLGFTPGSIREMLSVPMQQTARCVRDHPEDVSEEEQAEIDRLFKFDELAGAYNPTLADPIKDLYRNHADVNDLKAYFRAWASMFIRHPDTYIEASYANYYEFFYPGEARMKYYTNGWTEIISDYTNELIEGLGKQFTLPSWSKRFRILKDSVIEAGLLNILPLSLLMTPSLYYWGTLILLCWAGLRKKREGTALFYIIIPPLIILLITLFGPANGSYGRYLLPVTAFLPTMIMMMMVMRDEEG